VALSVFDVLNAATAAQKFSQRRFTLDIRLAAKILSIER
jgi:hypothetical protein